MNVQLKNEHARIMAEIQVKQENFVRKERAFTAKIEVNLSSFVYMISASVLCLSVF
jgi:hypothetical protein